MMQAASLISFPRARVVNRIWALSSRWASRGSGRLKRANFIHFVSNFPPILRHHRAITYLVLPECRSWSEIKECRILCRSIWSIILPIFSLIGAHRGPHHGRSNDGRPTKLRKESSNTQRLDITSILNNCRLIRNRLAGLFLLVDCAVEMSRLQPAWP